VKKEDEDGLARPDGVRRSWLRGVLAARVPTSERAKREGKEERECGSSADALPNSRGAGEMENVGAGAARRFAESEESLRGGWRGGGRS